jgi:hypothetical protein
MKKVSLLLGMAILFGVGGMAQKTATGNLTPAQIKAQRAKMVQNYKVESGTSALKPNPSKAPLSGYYMESFEGTFLPDGWTKQTVNSTHNGWDQCANGTTPLNSMWEGTQTVPPMGGNFVTYCCYMTGYSSSGYDQWLITPQFTVAASDSLKFYIFRYGAFQDSLDVMISTSGNDIPSFTTTLLSLDTSKTPDNAWKQYAFDLTAYAGQNIYIAFREHVLDDDPNEVVGAYYALDRVFLGNVGALTDVATSSIDMNDKYLQSTCTPSASFYNEGGASQTFDVTMTINPGGYSSTKTVSNLVSATLQQVTFDTWDVTQASGNYTCKVYTSLSGDDNANNDTLTKQIKVVSFKNKAYVFIVYDFTDPMVPLRTAIYDLADPDNVWVLNSDFDVEAYPWVMGGAWDNNHWYGTNTNSEFVNIDTLTGEVSTIGSMGFLIRDIAYDNTTSTMFGVSNSSLFTINTATGEATLVGDLGQTGFNTLACKQGVLYATNQTADKLFSVDKTTGIATEIGSMGFNSNEYSQGLDFAPDGNLFMSAYNVIDSTYSSGELRELNISTGASSLLHVFPEGNNIAGFVIPGSSWQLGLNVNNLSVENSHVDIYPNPAKDVVYLISADQIKSYNVMNASGQVVLSDKANNSTVTLNTSELKNGFYFVQIETVKGIVTKKVSVCK